MSAAPSQFGRVARSATRGLRPARSASDGGAHRSPLDRLWQSWHHAWHDCATDVLRRPRSAEARSNKFGSPTRAPCTGRFWLANPTVNSWSEGRTFFTLISCQISLFSGHVSHISAERHCPAPSVCLSPHGVASRGGRHTVAVCVRVRCPCDAASPSVAEPVAACAAERCQAPLSVTHSVSLYRILRILCVSWLHRRGRELFFLEWLSSWRR